MRREKKVKVGGRQITVKELTAEQLLGFYQTDEGFRTLSGFVYGDLERVAEIMSLCTDLPVDELKGMSGTDFLALLSVLREVHADFLPILREEVKRMEQAMSAGPPSQQ